MPQGRRWGRERGNPRTFMADVVIPSGAAKLQRLGGKLLYFVVCVFRGAGVIFLEPDFRETLEFPSPINPSVS